MDTKALDRRFFGRTMSLPMEITRAQGSYIYDRRGRRYLDFLTGWCVGNLGWSNAEIRRALRRPRPPYVHPGFLYRPWAELAALLASIAPGRLRVSYRATGGTEAVEVALQIAICHTGRRKFMSLEGSYHGNSFGAMSIAASDYRKTYPNLFPGCYKLEPPLDRKAAARVETRLRKRDVAAFIMEPISLNLGVLIPEPNFMDALQGMCRRYGTLLIADEVASGFGRTGKVFACEHYGLEPDILCFAKAATGGYAGIGGAMTTEKIARSIRDKFGLWSTYGWHPLGVEAALAGIGYLVKHRRALLAHVEALEKLFRSRLERMDFGARAEVRVKGAAIGVELDAEGRAEEIQRRCFKAGILFEAEAARLLLLPPLNLSLADARRGLDILERCL